MSERLIDLTGRSGDGTGDRPQLPHVTVVVPTMMSRDDTLLACLRSILAQSYPYLDVLLVDNRPPHATAARDAHRPQLPDDPRLAVLHQPTPGASAARSLGLAHATGEIVCFTDDDTTADPDWVLAVVRRFLDEPALDCVTGLIDAAELRTDAQQWFEDFYGGFAGIRTYAPLTFRLDGQGRRRRPVVAEVGPDGQVRRRFSLFGTGTVGAGANMAWRATALRQLGGFDTRLGPGTPALGGEDLATFVRLLWRGGRIGYEPGAVVAHTHRADPGGLRRQLHGYGVGFTAMITSVVVEDPWLGVALLTQVPRAVRVRSAEVLGRLRHGGTGREAPPPVPRPRDGEQADGAPPAPAYPRSLVWVEAAGWALGPVAYLRSALRR